MIRNNHDAGIKRTVVYWHKLSRIKIYADPGAGRGGYSHTLPIQVCAAQRGCDFEAPDLERGIHFKGVF